MTIACEICITTDDEHELGNIRKCLEWGYKHVVAISPDPKRLKKLQASITKQLQNSEQQRVRFCSPEELFTFIQELEVQNISAQRTVRGYKVKTKLQSGDSQDAKQRGDAVAKVIADALNRMQNRKK